MLKPSMKRLPRGKLPPSPNMARRPCPGKYR
jgi:hypothetical protein